ncbi:MAG: PepSY-associated TM helix domain-containing protein [Rhodothalassiaceae bacterium]
MEHRWPRRSAQAVARALSGHATLGLAAAAILYILTLSGTILVVDQALQRWEQPAVPETAAAAPQAVARAAKAALAQAPDPGHHLFVRLPSAELPRLVVTTDHGAWFADAHGRLLAPERHPFTQFVLDLHYYLHLPAAGGLVVVGLFGVIMVALAVSGLLAHPRIFRDAFRLRLGAGPRLFWADIHNRLSVWTAPFHIAVSLSGAVLGLTSLAALGIAALGPAQQVDAVFEPVFGAEPAADPQPAPLADIAAALRLMAQRFADTRPAYVIVHEPGTGGQHLQILAEQPFDLGFGEYYVFDAAGQFTGRVGMTDGTVGQQAIASMYRLHFGSFAGWPVKLAYLVFGALMTLIICSGLSLFFARKQAQGQPLPRAAAAWSGLVWGVPAMFAVLLFTARAGLTQTGLASAFWIGLIGLLAVCSAAPRRATQIRRLLQSLVAIALFAAAGIAVAEAGPAVWPVTLSWVGLAGLFAVAAARGHGRQAPATRPSAVPVERA